MILEVLSLLIAGFILTHASLRIYHRIVQQDVWSIEAVWKLGADLAWFVLSVGMLWLWPEALDPFTWPRRSLVFVATLAIFPIALAQDKRKDSISQRLTLAYRTVVIVVVISAGIILGARYLLYIRPRIEGMDFYYYVCVARDIAAGFRDLSYFHFPGVFLFWRIPFEAGYGDLASLQWWYICAIVANGFFVGAVVTRTVRNLPAGFFAGCWYIALCSRFEAFLGVTEPLATLPVLIGLFVWAGRPLSGRSGLFRTITLGTAFGLALFAKQQGGLLCLGILGVLFTYLIKDGFNSKSLFPFVLMTVWSAVVFLSGVLLQVNGIENLLRGLRILRIYQSESNLWNAVWHFVPAARVFAFASLVAALTWFTMLTVRRFRHFLGQPWFHVMGYTVIAGFATLIQFQKRAYGHYALLAIPMLIVAIVVPFVEIGRYLPANLRKSPFGYVAVLVLAITPMIRMNARTPGLFLWPIHSLLIPSIPSPGWRVSSKLASDMVSLTRYVAKGEDIYILPPYRNEIHFFVGTRSVSGSLSYGWDKLKALSEVIKSPGLDGVIVTDCDPTYSLCKLFEFETAEDTLASHGFQPVAKLKTMVLWRKKTVHEQTSLLPRKDITNSDP